MKSNEIGPFGLRDVLALAQTKAIHHESNRDAWAKAIRTCVMAQKIRRRRTLRSKPLPRTYLKDQNDWQAAMLAAIQASRSRTAGQLHAGSWNRCLQNKMTSIRNRMQETSSSHK